MAILDLSKVVNLADAQEIYKDLRDRYDPKYEKPATGIPASDLAAGVIPNVDNKAPIIFSNVVGNPAVFADGADDMPVDSLKVTLNPMQGGSGTASPQNVRPIYPWNGVVVNQGSTNLLNAVSDNIVPFFQSGYDNYTLNDGVITTSGTTMFGFKIAVEPGQWLNFAFDASDDVHLLILAYTTEPSQIGSTDTPLVYDVLSSSNIIVPSNVYWLVCGISTTSSGVTIQNIRITQGTGVKAYEPYKPITKYLISFENPVCGGVIDVVKKTAKITHIFFNRNSSTMNNSTGFPGWKGAGIRDILGAGLDKEYNGQIMSVGSYFGVNTKNDLDILFLPKSYYNNMTQEDWIELAVDVQIAIPVPNPVEVPFSSTVKVLTQTGLVDTIIESFYGSNNFWSNANGNLDITYRADTELYISGTHPVNDVRVDGASVLQNGVANIPMASSNDPGVVRVGDQFGTFLATGGILAIAPAEESLIKLGGTYETTLRKPIVPYRQHISVYYGLSKLAGVDLKNETVTVGTYPDASKQAIQKLFGLDGILGPYEMDNVADQAYAIGEPFIYNGKQYKTTAAISEGGVITPDGNCELATAKDLYVKKTDYAASQSAGVIKVTGNKGLYTLQDGTLCVDKAADASIKNGVNAYYPIVPEKQHISVFYGLSKLAGVDLASETVTVGTYPANAKAAILAMLGANGNGLEISNGTLQITGAGATTVKAGTSWYYPIIPALLHNAVYYGLSKLAGVDLANETVTVGTYPQASKTAIQSMLGIEADVPLVETVSGTTPSITGMPNVRYICGTCSTLSITPPASGSIVVRFDSGSTATLLTVPNTVKFPAWFDATALDADTTYELIITDGVYGGVMSWAD